MASAIQEFMEGLFQGQRHVDAKRREDALYYFEAASVKKNFQRQWTPTNIPYIGFRKYPNIVIDNWAAAWKVRRHYEEQTEIRRAAGKPTY